MKYSRFDETAEIPITYLPTGEIDYNRTSQLNISIAINLLEPTISVLQQKAAILGINFDFWEFMNWIFVTFYWTMLANVGQVTPINYAPLLQMAPLPRLNIVDFTNITVPGSANNIFLHDQLFQKYASYLTGTLLPLLGRTSPQIESLNETNPFEPVPTTFVRSYICTVREWKDRFSLIFAVFTTVWVFVLGPRGGLLTIAAFVECRLNPRGSPLIYLTHNKQTFVKDVDTFWRTNSTWRSPGLITAVRELLQYKGAVDAYYADCVVLVRGAQCL